MWDWVKKVNGIKQKPKQKTSHRHKKQYDDSQREMGWGEVEEGTEGINGDGRRLDLRW